MNTISQDAADLAKPASSPGAVEAATRAPPPPASWRGAPRRLVAIGAVLSAMAMVVVDGGFSNVALPSMVAALRIAPADAILVVTAYQAAVLMALLPCAALGERFGYRRVFTSGVALFTLASCASALAPGLPWLVLARFAQGLGGAAILALGVALLRLTVSEAKLGAAVSWNALTVALSAAAGPAIGALILSHADWRWLYLTNLPVGLGVILATRALPTASHQSGRLDRLSIALNFGVFGLVVVATRLLISAPVVAGALYLASGLGLAVLVRRELPKARPLIPLDLLRSASFRISVLASVSCFTGQTAALIALPFYLHDSLGVPPGLAGLYLTAWPLSVAVAATLSGRMLNRAPSSWLSAAGAGLLATGLGAAAWWPLHGDPRLLVPVMFLCGAGFGVFQVTNNRNMFLSAPRDRSGAAGGMQGTARLSGQTAGAILVAQVFSLMPAMSAPQAAMAIGATFVLIAGVTSLLRGEAS